MHTFATDIPFTILIYNQFLTHSKIGIHHQHVNFTESRLTEMGNRLQGPTTVIRTSEKHLPEKTPLGKKYDMKSR